MALMSFSEFQELYESQQMENNSGNEVIDSIVESLIEFVEGNEYVTETEVNIFLDTIFEELDLNLDTSMYESYFDWASTEFSHIFETNMNESDEGIMYLSEGKGMDKMKGIGKKLGNSTVYNAIGSKALDYKDAVSGGKGKGVQAATIGGTAALAGGGVLAARALKKRRDAKKAQQGQQAQESMYHPGIDILEEFVEFVDVNGYLTESDLDVYLDAMLEELDEELNTKYYNNYVEWLNEWNDVFDISINESEDEYIVSLLEVSNTASLGNRLKQKYGTAGDIAHKAGQKLKGGLNLTKDIGQDVKDAATGTFGRGTQAATIAGGAALVGGAGYGIHRAIKKRKAKKAAATQQQQQQQ